MKRNKTMKNKYMTFVALAVAALATSCTSDDLAGQQQIQSQSSSQTVTITASVVDDNTTRTGMTKDENDNSKAKFYWHKGDAISVWTMNDNAPSSYTEFTTSDADGTTIAKFIGNPTGSIYGHALYPHNEKHKIDDSNLYNITVTYNLPATYTYNKVDGNIFPKDGSTYPANSTNMPMYGTLGSERTEFEHIGGLAVIRIDQMPAASGTLTVTADQKLSGDFKFGVANPEIATTSTNVTDADKKVTFSFSGANENKVGVFYLPLATGDYTNLTIKVTCDGTTQTIPYGSLTVARAGVTAIPLSTNSEGNLRYFVNNNDGSYTINGHKFIDLGLPSGLLWATMNVGADTETGYGNYYAWGETKPKGTYEAESYTYKDNPSTLDAEHDAATANWGLGVRMPTDEEFIELYEKCKGSWDGTKNGYTFTNNNNSIFLPAAGVFLDDTSGYTSGRCGYYWSSTLPENKTSFPNCLYFYANGSSCRICQRFYGLPVRPVAPKQ